MKTCFKCGSRKPPEDFYAHPQMSDKRVGKCKVCNKKENNANRRKKKRHYLKYDRKRDAEPRDKLLYNLKPGERDKLRAFQNNIDPITGQLLKPNANLDHCHTSGLVRGLLNPLSNRFLVDDLARLRAMQAYIEDPPAVKALGGPVYGLLGKAHRKKKMLYGPDGSTTPQVREAV